MLNRITLPRMTDVGWRLQQGFGHQLWVQLEGSGWCTEALRCYAIAPAETLNITPENSVEIWQLWRQRWRSLCNNANATGPHLRSLPPTTPGPLPGWYGYLGYEAGRRPRTDNTHVLPLASLGFFPCIVVELESCIEIRYLASHQSTAIQVEQALTASVTPENYRLISSFNADADFSHYQSGFKRINDYIHAGDCYQVNFAQRFSAQFSGDIYAAYCRIQALMQSPFAGFVRHPQGALLSFSPEQFIEIQGQSIKTSPIKGTRPRDADPLQDAKNATALHDSTKDQAENLMIVDLLRNDLSKVATLGSVKVPRLFAIESFTHVHHMVSTIEAQLRAEYNAVDALQACFPGGSITGAPKKRACEIIDEVEPFPRSAYCGSLFYADVAGNLQSNILIRTVVAEANRLYCWGGGGIVADSKCQSEFDETLHKVGQLMQLFENHER